ncbi:MAG: hypothetical protein ACW98X_21930 [Promethearchaeota archaeon]|jgi:hypothetical protein
MKESVKVYDSDEIPLNILRGNIKKGDMLLLQDYTNWVNTKSFIIIDVKPFKTLKRIEHETLEEDVYIFEVFDSFCKKTRKFTLDEMSIKVYFKSAFCKK